MEQKYRLSLRLSPILIFSLFILTTGLCFSQEWKTKPIRVAVGKSQPPYINSSKRSGMEYEIVEEALKNAGFQLFPVFVNFGDVPEQLVEKNVDAAMAMKESSGVEAFYSDEYITYHNFPITLESSGITINKVGDLEGKTISAFPNAELYLGPEFKKIARDDPGYSEVALQYKQNIDLYSGVVDVVIADINVFKWNNLHPRVTESVDVEKEVVYHRIFKPSHYSVAFRDEQIRDAFNKALAEMKSSGRYKEIVDKYIPSK